MDAATDKWVFDENKFREISNFNQCRWLDFEFNFNYWDEPIRQKSLAIESVSHGGWNPRRLIFQSSTKVICSRKIFDRLHITVIYSAGCTRPTNSNNNSELGMPRNSIGGMQYKAHDGAICRYSSSAITCWKIQLAGYRARRFPQQYWSIARTSNDAMCPPIGFNSLLFTCCVYTAHPPQTRPS